MAGECRIPAVGQLRRLAVGHRSPSRRAMAAATWSGGTHRTGGGRGRRAARRSGRGGCVAGRPSGGGRGARPAGQPGTRGAPAALRRGPVGDGGGGLDGYARGHSEEPRTPCTPAAAIGAARRLGGAGRCGMSDPVTERSPAGRRAGRVAVDVDLDRVWLGVAAEVWRRRTGWVERTAARLLRSPGL